MSKTSTIFTYFESVWLMWFVICLFAAQIIYTAIMKHLQRFPWYISLSVMILLSTGGMVTGVKIAYLVWSLDLAFTALIFMWVGDYMNRSGVLKKVSPLAAIVVCFPIWLFLFLQNIQIEMATRSYPGIWLCLIEAILGSMIIVCFSILLDKISNTSAVLAWCGKNSMIILAIHCLEMRFADWDTLFPGIFISEMSWIKAGIFKILVILVITWFVTIIKQILFYMNDDIV